MSPASEPPLLAQLRRVLGSYAPARIADDRLIAASVLIPLFPRADTSLGVWLVRRSEAVRAHRGQVALPGGKRDPGETPLSTALREAEEEIGLPAAQVELLGQLDDYATVTGYVITPFAGWLASPFEPRPRPGEVARVFAAPFATFEAEGSPRTLARPGEKRIALSYDVEGELVWGATAAILRQLARLLTSAADAPRDGSNRRQ